MIRIAFSAASQRAIERRATDMTGRRWCEQCGAECPTRADYEIDHVVPEGVQPANDNRPPLTADDGKLLCLKCHDKKTRRDRARHRQAQAPGRQASPHRRRADARSPGATASSRSRADDHSLSGKAHASAMRCAHGDDDRWHRGPAMAHLRHRPEGRTAANACWSRKWASIGTARASKPEIQRMRRSARGAAAVRRRTQRGKGLRRDLAAVIDGNPDAPLPSRSRADEARISGFGGFGGKSSRRKCHCFRFGIIRGPSGAAWRVKWCGANPAVCRATSVPNQAS